MENNKLSFCYSKLCDINVEQKGNTSLNSNCDGCVYFDFCLKDIASIKNKKEKNENKSEDNVIDSSENSSIVSNKSDIVNENNKESKSKKVTEAKSKKSNKKKKETIEDLLSEDIF